MLTTIDDIIARVISKVLRKITPKFLWGNIANKFSEKNKPDVKRSLRYALYMAVFLVVSGNFWFFITIVDYSALGIIKGNWVLASFWIVSLFTVMPVIFIVTLAIPLFFSMQAAKLVLDKPREK